VVGIDNKLLEEVVVVDPGRMLGLALAVQL